LDRERRDIDPHSNDLHCVDVSTYEDVVYDKVPREKCSAEFPKVTTNKVENICKEITTLQCSVLGYTKCDMTMESIPYKGFKMEEKNLPIKKCTEKMKTELHKKKKSECKDVTKQNCVTKWEVLPSGEKVWSGNEDCEPVTWNECKLVEYDVPFKVPAIVCEDAGLVPWTDCVETQESQMVSKMTCQPYAAVECQPITSRSCVTVQWTESHQVAEEKCYTDTVNKPRQEVSHKKKCLLPDTQTKLPNGPLQGLLPKEELKQNVFPGPVGRAGREFNGEGRPSPVFKSEN